MKTNSILPYICFILLISMLYSCSGFEKIGTNLGKGLSTTTHAIGDSLVDGALTRISNGKEKELLKHLLDSMISNAGLSANKQVRDLRDSIINDATTARLNRLISQAMQSAVGDSTKAKLAALRDELLGAKLRMQIAALRNDLLGDETNLRIQRILKNASSSLLSDSTNIRLATLMDTLLGDKTNNRLRSIIDTAMITFASRFREQISPQIDKNLSFIKKYATELLTTIALLAAGIIILVWRNRQKYLKAVTLLTSHIQNIPDQHIYDDLTAKIQTDAVKAGVEPTLRTVLKDNGLLGTESWKKMNKNGQ